jgi:hypothetical protein
MAATGPVATGTGRDVAPKWAAAAPRDVRSATGTPIGRVVRLQRLMAFLVPLATAVPAAWVLVIQYHSVYNDAQSRLANAYYVLYSRDPHLAAVGFVWNPLPSIVDLPLLLLKNMWPVLSNEAFAANLMSCLFFALACHQLYRFFEDLELGAVTRWGLWLCFAANPLIFYYAINGMSEALFLWTLVFTTRFLTRWIQADRIRDLIYAGWMLGIAYVARNEALASAVCAGAVVLIVAYRRSDLTGRKARLVAALTPTTLFLLPFVLAFVGWAVLSWIIVGHPFEQFSSIYGNASQIKHSGVAANQVAKVARLKYAVLGSQSVAPLLGLTLVLGVARGWIRKDARILGVGSVIVSVLAFEILAYTDNQIFPWYRYYIYACPAIVMAAACLAAPGKRPLMLVFGRDTLFVPTRVRRVLLGTLALLLAAPGILTTAHTLGSEKPGAIESQDRYQIAYILWPKAKDADLTIVKNHADVAQLASEIDAMHLNRGAIMVDNFTTCIVPLVLDTKHPRVFSIPNDQDYQEKLGVPYQFGIRYFLVPDPAGTGDLDALNRQFPGLYQSGQGLATLVREIHMAGCPTFRLYRLLPQTG